MQAIRRAALLSTKVRFTGVRSFGAPAAAAPATSAAQANAGPDEADRYVDSLVKGEFDKNVNRISEIMKGDDHSKKALILKALGKCN